MVDDWLPIMKKKSKSSTLMADLSQDGALWAAILEKAFAKRYGNYEHIVSGLPSEAFKVLTGSPYVTYSHKEKDLDTIWRMLVSHDQADDFIICNSESAQIEKDDLSGFSKDHAYAVLGTLQLDSGKRLVKIRNSWSKALATASFSDSETLNEGGDREADGYKDNNDGIYYIDIETYVVQFTETFVTFDVSKWSQAKFLKLNDLAGGVPGTSETCGEQCTKHSLTLLSDIDQLVYL